MKVMLRRCSAGKLVVYVPKKDLEEEAIAEADGENGKILTLANGWQLSISGLEEPWQLPQTVEAKLLAQ